MLQSGMLFCFHFSSCVRTREEDLVKCCNNPRERCMWSVKTVGPVAVMRDGHHLYFGGKFLEIACGA